MKLCLFLKKKGRKFLKTKKKINRYERIFQNYALELLS